MPAKELIQDRKAQNHRINKYLILTDSITKKSTACL